MLHLLSKQQYTSSFAPSLFLSAWFDFLRLPATDGSKIAFTSTRSSTQETTVVDKYYRETNITDENVCKLYSTITASDERDHHMHHIQKCERYIEANLRVLSKTNCIRELSLKSLVGLVCKSSLSGDDRQHIVVEWLAKNHRSTSTRTTLPTMVSATTSTTITSTAIRRKKTHRSTTMSTLTSAPLTNTAALTATKSEIVFTTTAASIETSLCESSISDTTKLTTISTRSPTQETTVGETSNTAYTTSSNTTTIPHLPRHQRHQ